MSEETCTKLALAFVDHFNDRTDDAELYSEDALVWNNLTGKEQLHSDTTAVSNALRAALPDLRWEEIGVHAWDSGFCVQYTFRATLPDGVEARIPACGIGEVRDSRIVRFSEYLDSAQVAPLGQALLAARAQAGT